MVCAKWRGRMEPIDCGMVRVIANVAYTIYIYIVREIEVKINYELDGVFLLNQHNISLR